jgi:hypothetical protein
VIAAVTAALGAHALAGLPGERFELDALDRIVGALCVSAGLIADRFELRTRFCRIWFANSGT